MSLLLLLLLLFLLLQLTRRIFSKKKKENKRVTKYTTLRNTDEDDRTSPAAENTAIYPSLLGWLAGSYTFLRVRPTWIDPSLLFAVLSCFPLPLSLSLWDIAGRYLLARHETWCLCLVVSGDRVVCSWYTEGGT